MKNSIKGGASVVILAVLLIGAGLTYTAKKIGLFDGATHRAKQSEKTTDELLASEHAQSSAAASYFTVVGQVADTLPASREKDFMQRGIGIGLSYLQKPDPQKLLEAEQLKNAVLSGQLDLANKLNASALQRADQADQRTARAIAGKRESDNALQQAAAEARGADAQAFIFLCLFVAAGGLWLYTKVTHVSPGAVSRMVTDIRSGGGESNPAIIAIDTHTSGAQQLMTKANVKFHGFLDKVGGLFS